MDINPIYCSYEVYQLLAEKEFDLYLNSVVMKNLDLSTKDRKFGDYHFTEENQIIFGKIPNWNNKFCKSHSRRKLEILVAPEQWMIIEWLKIKYDIHINVKHIANNNKYTYCITGDYKKNKLSIYNQTEFNFSKEAIEEAIITTLKYIIK